MTGGSLDLYVNNSFIPFVNQGRLILEEVKKLNDDGDVFPLWAIC